MGIFKREIIRKIHDGVWGHMVTIHKIDVDTLSKNMRCVEREGVLENGMPVTFLRIFRPAEVQNKGIIVTGWETFNEHPNLILFEGYLTRANEAHLERRK